MDNFIIVDYLKTHRQPYPVPPALHTAYSQALNKLRQNPDLASFEKLKLTEVVLNNPSSLSLAAQFYRMFPSHYYKVLHALIEIERNESKHCPLFLDCPDVFLLDIGCGSGAASNAMLSFVSEFRALRAGAKDRLSVATISFVGIDPNPHATSAYLDLLAEHRALIPNCLIRGNQWFVDKPFNREVLPEIASRMGHPDHIVFAVMSNVIKPFWETWFKNFPHIGLFGNEQAQLLIKLLEDTPIDKLIILAIGTRDRNDPTKWGGQLADLFRVLMQQFPGVGHQFWATPVKQVHIEFENFPSSYGGRKPSKKLGQSDYYVSIGVATNSTYHHDHQWQQTLRHDNLELAWSRTRYYLNYEAMADQVEIALFDGDLQGKLTRLQRYWESYTRNQLNIEHALHFEQPKASPDIVRPKMMCRLEEQIVATALVQQNGVRASNSQKASYSFRLNSSSEGTEYLYYYWLEQYRAYVDAARNAALAQGQACVISTDISSFYININQSRLLRIVQEKLNLKSTRLADTLDILLKRDCGGSHHKLGYGLPQGHITAGFMANMYLDNVDAEFGGFLKQLGSIVGFSQIEYQRFADDMLIVVPHRVDAAHVLARIDAVLQKLELERSEEKTQIYKTTKEFLDTLEWDEQLEETSHRFRALTTALFAVPDKYVKLVDENRWDFLRRYQQHLSYIKFYTSVNWLSRKLHQHTTCQPNRFVRLIYPEFHTSSEQWSNEFGTSNSNWIMHHQELYDELSNLFWKAYDGLQNSRQGSSKAKNTLRHLRFSTLLGFPHFNGQRECLRKEEIQTPQG